MSVASRRRARGMWLLSGFGGSGSSSGPSYDTDAQTYITAVEAADGQSLETGVKDAINAFVVGCKSDGIWTAIKASCILAGARTLTGALVPLVGTAPTNNNFVSGDYSRTTGLAGNGSTKWLNSNRNNNTDPQDSCHIYFRSTTDDTLTATTTRVMGTSGSGGPRYIYFNTSNNAQMQINGTSAANFATNRGAGGYGANRSASNAANFLSPVGTSTSSSTSTALLNENIGVFALFNGVGKSDATLAFYSIGESLDLALLDSRVTTLITDIGTALA